MGGHENNAMGFQHGEDDDNSILNCLSSSGLSTNVSDLCHPSFLGASAWDPLVSLGQSPQSFGASSMVSHSEFANSSYPIVLGNSHLVQYMSDSNLEDMVPKVPSYASGNFSGMVVCGDMANRGYVSNYTTNEAQSQGENSTPEDGVTASAAPNGNRRKRGLDYNSTFNPNKVGRGGQFLILCFFGLMS